MDFIIIFSYRVFFKIYKFMNFAIEIFYNYINFLFILKPNFFTLLINPYFFILSLISPPFSSSKWFLYHIIPHHNQNSISNFSKSPATTTLIFSPSSTKILSNHITSLFYNVNYTQTIQSSKKVFINLLLYFFSPKRASAWTFDTNLPLTLTLWSATFFLHI